MNLENDIALLESMFISSELSIATIAGTNVTLVILRDVWRRQDSSIDCPVPADLHVEVTDAHISGICIIVGNRRTDIKEHVQIDGLWDCIDFVSNSKELFKKHVHDQTPVQYDKPEVGLNQCSVNLTQWIIKVDHIRNLSRYKKHLSCFASRTNVKCLLFLAPRKICFVLEGELENVKTYMKLYKSEHVDVDSKGKPCKERMSNVCQMISLVTLCLTDNFNVVDCDQTDLERPSCISNKFIESILEAL